MNKASCQVALKARVSMSCIIPHHHFCASAYLADELRRVTDSDSRRQLRSASTSTLVVSPTRRTTIGDCAFPVAGAGVWNALPSFVTDSATVTNLKRHLKTYLFTVAVASLCYDCVQCSRSLF